MFKFKGRILALLLAVLLVIGGMPVIVLADGGDIGDVDIIYEDDYKDEIVSDVDADSENGDDASVDIDTDVDTDVDIDIDVEIDMDDEIYAGDEVDLSYSDTCMDDYCIELLVEALTGEIGAPVGLGSVVTLTFNPNGGTPAQEVVVPAVADSILDALPQPPTRTGYVFVGWFTDNSLPAPGVNFTGVRITAGSTVPGANTTYWARWVRPLRFGYDNLVSVNSPEVFALADNIIYEIKPLFEANFGLRFVQEMAAHYEPRLNMVPPLENGVGSRHAPTILDYWPLRSNNSTVRFRFVDFPIFWGGQVFGVGRASEGLRRAHLGEMVVGLNNAQGHRLSHELFRFVVTHEISHVLGAPDCGNSACVMFVNAMFPSAIPVESYNNWCTWCRNAVLSYVWRVGQDSAHLVIQGPEVTPSPTPTATPAPTPEPVAGVSSWEELRAAVNASQQGVMTVIEISSSFAATAPHVSANYAITIPANRYITLVSSNTLEDDVNVRVLTQRNLRSGSSWHFIVSANSSLTLCRNITLCGDAISGGVLVMGELIMNPGSVIENIANEGVHLGGSGTGDATRARFAMTGGVIRNNVGHSAGGVHIGTNAMFIMSGDSEIYGNAATNQSSTRAVAGGVLLATATSVFEMRDNATIRDNVLPDGFFACNWQHPGNAGGVHVWNGTFTMYGGTISNNSSTSVFGGGGVRVDRGLFTMNGGSISGNTSSEWGGAVSVRGESANIITFIMNDGAISDNIGTGLSLANGEMTINDGIISGNTNGGVAITVGHNLLMSTMYGGTISGNSSIGARGAGVHVGGGAFTMAGGTISNNVNESTTVTHSWGTTNAVGGGGVYVTSNQIFNMISPDARIENNKSIGTVATTGGGGIRVRGTANIAAGVITGNTAPFGGGILVHSGGTQGRLNMTGGYISNNTATYNGGGIHSNASSNALILPVGAFIDLNIGEAVIFSGNRAGNGASAPPDNRLPRIAATTASIWGNPLNNYDINYTGRLGQEHGLTSWAELRAAVNAAPAGVVTTISILSSFDAPTGAEGNAIVIPVDRQIILVSSNTTPGTANERILGQPNSGQRHFIVHGSLTLGQNMTLAVSTGSGGVQVLGGSFTMADGSNIIGG